MRAIKLGDAEIRRVEEMTHKMPLSALTRDEAVLAAHASWLSPRFMDHAGNWDMVYQSWILLVDGKVVVVDPCVGNGRNNPAFPPFHMLDTPYIERFGATGIRPQDVDYVFCTHLHGDHCGWNTELRGGRYVPTFPHARYILVRREVERWDSRRPGHGAVAANAGVFETSVLPVIEAGLAELVDDRHRLSPSLSIEPAHGHTAGHSVLHLVSQAERALFTGDAFHHPLELVRPELDLGASEDFKVTVETRRRLIDLAVAHHALLIPAHFPAPHAGRLRRQGETVVFEALDE